MAISTLAAPASLSAAALWALRVDLAAAFHVAARMDWHESVANHFSAATSGDGKRFLMNRKWVHFGEITASSLQELDADDPGVLEGPEAPDPTAWTIHGSLHRALPHARVVLHCHPPYATALSCLEDPSIPPIDQTCAAFYGRVAIDRHYGGLASEAEEGERLVAALGDKSIMMMGNHGVLVLGETVAAAFDALYYLERAARTVVLAYSTGRPLNPLSDEIAAKTASQSAAYGDMATAHFEAQKRILDREGSVYAE